MPRSEVVHSGTGIDLRDLRAFTQAMRKASKPAAKELRNKLKDAGKIVEIEARAKAAEHSKSIPPTIKTTSGGATVSIKAGSSDVPIAALYELGNKGSKSDDPTFRHPIYGRWDVNPGPSGKDPRLQRRYPFLAPAAAAKQDELVDAVGKVLDEAVRIITLDK